jgi:hypothetical protein
MKTIVISVLLVFSFHLNIFPQNRICGWETEKITSVEVEFTSPNNEKEINVFNARHDMDTIISFLKNVDFRTLNSSNLDSLEQNDDDLEYKISFQGQRDQVYLLKHSACIGKTSFLIDQNVIQDFDTLIQELVEN